jgi:hypothetical protein
LEDLKLLMKVSPYMRGMQAYHAIVKGRGFLNQILDSGKGSLIQVG